MITAFALGLAVGSWVMWIIMRIVVSNMQKQIKSNHETIEHLMASNVKARMEALNNTLEVVRRTGEIVNLAAVAVRNAQSKVTPSTN